MTLKFIIRKLEDQLEMIIDKKITYRQKDWWTD